MEQNADPKLEIFEDLTPKYLCSVCGYEEKNTVPDYFYVCPVCRAGGSRFLVKRGERIRALDPELPNPDDYDDEIAALPRCPKCGSTQLGEGKRGLLDVLKKKAPPKLCENCGYCWTDAAK